MLYWMVCILAGRKSRNSMKFEKYDGKTEHGLNVDTGSGMKPKVRARAAELNAEPELF